LRPISITGVGSRFAVASAGLILVTMAFFPKIAATISIVPPFDLGGIPTLTFAMIAGIRILAEAMKDQRDLLLVATSLASGIGANFILLTILQNIHSSFRLLAGDGIFVIGPGAN
jgi:uric acid transporter